VSSSNDVANYFDKTADDFDKIYRDDTSRLRALRDRVRGTVRARLGFTEKLVSDEDAHSVLDVGCGSGRFGIALAATGIRVVGIDFAPKMIDLAIKLSSEAGTSDLTEFVVGDYLSWSESRPERFDVALAMGVLDYVEEPVPLIRRAAEQSRVLAVSFPRLWHPLVPIRLVKFRVQRCPLFLYRRSEVDRIAHEAGLQTYRVERFHRDYLLVAKISANS
jgi:2-polyprenyl-3-methyl-5-hydroxy-6-metoxy-1,4-benzoquinol methylase